MNILALICAISMARADCTPDTAIQTLRIPTEMAMCGMPPQGFVATSGFVPREDEYLIVICTRKGKPA